MTEKRALGRGGPEITTVGFGAWAAGGPWKIGWGPQKDEDSIAAIQRSLDLGVDWIDTAAIYGLGHSEEVVGRAVRGRRDAVFIATRAYPKTPPSARGRARRREARSADEAIWRR